MLSVLSHLQNTHTYTNTEVQCVDVTANLTYERYFELGIKTAFINMSITGLSNLLQNVVCKFDALFSFSLFVFKLWFVA